MREDWRTKENKQQQKWLTTKKLTPEEGEIIKRAQDNLKDNVSRILTGLRFYPTHLDWSVMVLWMLKETWDFWVRGKGLLITHNNSCGQNIHIFFTKPLSLYPQKLMQILPSDAFPYNGWVIGEKLWSWEFLQWAISLLDICIGVNQHYLYYTRQ